MNQTSWFQYRLRSMMAIVTILAVAVAAVSNHLNRARQQRVAVEHLRIAGANVQYEPALLEEIRSIQVNVPFGVATGKFSHPSADEESLGWVVSTFGIDAFYEVHEVSISDSQAADQLFQAQRLHWLKQIRLEHPEDEETWDALLKCDQIETLTVERGTSHARPLPGLSKLSNLRRLAIYHGELSREDVTEISQLTNLVELELHEVRASDQSLQPLSSLSQLERFELEYAESTSDITERGMEFLDAMPNLRSLSLVRIPLLSGVTLEKISRLAQLRILNLNASNIEIESFARLNRLPHLLELNLAGTNIGDPGLSEIARLTRLRQLDVSFTEITDESSKSVSRLQKLTSLGFSSLNISDKSLLELSKLNHVRELKLGGSKVTDEGLKHLHSMTDLRTLVVDPTNVSPRGIEAFRQARPDVRVW